MVSVNEHGKAIPFSGPPTVKPKDINT